MNTTMELVTNHFKRVDPILYRAIHGDDWYVLKHPHDRFTGLCRIIIGQQLSTKAARSIFEKFIAQFPRKRPTPERVLAISENELRACGLSRAKCRSLFALAKSIHERSLPLHRLHTLADEDVAAHLIGIRGIGRWSAEMFLMFYLGREDVFSPGDLGLRSAIKQLYRKRRLPTPHEAETLARRWSPYRSYACRILWQSLDGKPV